MTSSTKALAERCFASTGNVLTVSGIPIRRLADQYGTPLFVYDRAPLDRNLGRLRKALPGRFEVYYSVKANPTQAIVRHFFLRGCGLEIASAGEYGLARAAGCPGERIVYAGPGKTDAELELVLQRGIGEIHIESFGEAERIARIAEKLNARARAAIRINPTGEVQGGAMRMGGKPAPFGVDEEELEPLLRYVTGRPVMDFCGIHIFAGTQILDSSVLAAQYRKGIEIARRVSSLIGKPLSTIDFGGGLGIPYFARETSLDLAALREELLPIVSEIDKDPAFHGTRLLVEPGRFLVGEAGVYIARILDRKVSRGKTFLVIDGGMNHHLAASGNLGQAIKRNYPIALVEKLDGPEEEIVDVVGPLCTPLDTLGRGVNLPKAEPGDLVGIFQSGAYARSASPRDFLSHPAAPEVWVENGESCLIRDRGKPEDFLQNTHLPQSLDPGRT